MLRFALIAFLLASLPSRGHADEAQAQARATELLGQIESGGDAQTLSDAATELAKLGPDSVHALEKFLARERKHSDADRRAILASIGAAVPNEKGRFATPGRKTKEQKKREDQLDWLAKLLELSGSPPALGSVRADVAVIRALAASRQTDAARVILEFAFNEVGAVFRDECGRYLRKMSPYSIPALIIASQARRKNASKARYANYQLERLDRQNPNKAMAAAGSELKIEILEAFADSQFREAVYATLDYVDHIDPRVRRAARDAWMEYATGRPPKKAPKRKLVMPGGKLSDEEEPLWLNHRELADIEIRRRLEELTGTAPARKASLKEMSEQLFAYFDAKRREKQDASFARGTELGKQGKWAEAALLFDQILAQDPQFDRKDKMAEAYFELGKQLQKEKKWHEASTAYAKAHAVDSDAARAKEALAAHHFARGQLQKDETGDGSAELERASELAPEDSGSPRTWMLYGGIVWFAAGALLLALGLRRRRAAGR